ncbi:MAG: acylphosphatase [Thermotogota bacterium]|nr:acylphosphatase [Thermotogota bacterium]
MKTLKVTLFGRVQGVGFRYYATRKARSLNVTGYVRNKPDGSVEVVATADEKTLEKFVELLSQGPLTGHVTKVEKEELPLKKFSTFEVQL